MKKLLLPVAVLCMYVNINANNMNNENLNDTGVISIVYITNSSGVDNILSAENPSNDSGYQQFNCLYPAPAKLLPYGITSPRFGTKIIPGSKSQKTQQYVLVKSGVTIAYQFNSKCDSELDSERLSIRDAHNYSLYVNLGNMYQDINNGVLNYTKFVGDAGIFGNIMSNSLIKPFIITSLPKKND